MDISQLRTLIHVAELGSLSKAAGRLRIAQPALSRQIRLLEEELSLRLFERHGRGMLITEQGRDVLAHAHRVMAELETLRVSAAGPDAALHGRVAIGLTPTVGDVISVPLVAAFRAQHPGVTVQLVSGFSGNLLDWLHRGEVDVAVLYDPRATRGLRSEPLMQESLFLIGAPEAGLSHDRPVTFAQAASAPLLLPSSRQGLRIILEKFAQEAGTPLTVSIETDSYTALKNLVHHGYGSTILPIGPILDDLTAGRLCCAPICDPTPTRQLVLTYPSDRPVSRAAQFAGALLTRLLSEQAGRGQWTGLSPLRLA